MRGGCVRVCYEQSDIVVFVASDANSTIQFELLIVIRYRSFSLSSSLFSDLVLFHRFDLASFFSNRLKSISNLHLSASNRDQIVLKSAQIGDVSI